MRIPCFTPFVNTHLTIDVLKDTTVVIDGHNYFYKLYGESQLPYEFGCESDKYADYLREHLKMYQLSNVQCYIFFKGGHQDCQSRIEKQIKKKQRGNNHIIGGTDTDIVLPIFMKDVYKQVLNEMNFNYVICEYEAKDECIAFAQKHKYPILSSDVEFCFSGLKYIPRYTISFNAAKKCLECESFDLNQFVKKYKLDKNKLALFIVLTDEKIYDENYFNTFIRAVKITSHKFKRFSQLLRYLAENDFRSICENVIRHTRGMNKEKFMENIQKAKNLIEANHLAGIPMNYLENGKNLIFTLNDPSWFEKGVAGGYVAVDYVNLYRHKIIFSSWAIQDNDADDALLLSTEIITYAYNLLTNYTQERFKMLKDSDELKLKSGSVSKPSHEEVNSSVFENGWDEIHRLKLFEHFINQVFSGFHFECLKQLPENAVLIVVALAYFSKIKAGDTSAEVFSVLLSYILMDDSSHEFVKKITTREHDTAKVAMIKYFTTSKVEIAEILEKKLIHPLVEFQHCLQHLNYLNKLCGSPYKPTVYSRAYNGTFVFKVLYETKKKHNGDMIKFLNTKLNNDAPNVLNVLNNMFEICNSIVN